MTASPRAYGKTAALCLSGTDAMRLCLERIKGVDQMGLDVFGAGEHHRAKYLDGASAVILAAAVRTVSIILRSS